MSDLVRFSVAMPEDLLVAFDSFVARRGIAKNRSEVIRDLVRDALIEEKCDNPEQEVVGTLTIAFSHHANDLQSVLDYIQHRYFSQIISSTHIHLDAHNCLEVIIIRGRADDVGLIADTILGVKGVRGGKLVVTSLG